MNWLRKIWDDYSYLLFLLTIILIGIGIIGLVILARDVAIRIYGLLPAGFWGAVAGIVILTIAYFFLKDDWKWEKFGWHLAPSTKLWKISMGIFGILIFIFSIAWFFVPNQVMGLLSIIISIFILAVMMFITIFGAGPNLAVGILLLRRKDLTGIVLIIISIVGFFAINGVINEFASKFEKFGSLVESMVMTALIAFQLAVIAYLYIIRAFTVDKWTLREKNTSRSEDGSCKEGDE